MRMIVWLTGSFYVCLLIQLFVRGRFVVIYFPSVLDCFCYVVFLFMSGYACASAAIFVAVFDCAYLGLEALYVLSKKISHSLIICLQARVT